jgi:hypothetical protein
MYGNRYGLFQMIVLIFAAGFGLIGFNSELPKLLAE